MTYIKPNNAIVKAIPAILARNRAYFGGVPVVEEEP